MTMRIPNYITRINVEKEPLGAEEIIQSLDTYRIYYFYRLKMKRRRGGTGELKELLLLKTGKTAHFAIIFLNRLRPHKQ